jgi:hypothetical protein
MAGADRQRMNLYPLQSWSESVAGRCPHLDALVDPLPHLTGLDGNDRLVLSRLRDEIASAHTAIDGSRICIVESWSLMSKCELELRNRQ